MIQFGVWRQNRIYAIESPESVRRLEIKALGLGPSRTLTRTVSEIGKHHKNSDHST